MPIITKGTRRFTDVDSTPTPRPTRGRSPRTIEVRFSFLKSTKGTHRFNEVDDDGNEIPFADAVIGGLYVRKTAVGDAPPRALVVTIVVTP